MKRCWPLRRVSREGFRGRGGHGGSSSATLAAPDDESRLQGLLEQAVARVCATQQREMADQMSSLRHEVRSFFLDLKASQVAELDRQRSTNTGESIFPLKLTNLPTPI